jgi:hypothetical protein
MIVDAQAHLFAQDKDWVMGRGIRERLGWA